MSRIADCTSRSSGLATLDPHRLAAQKRSQRAELAAALPAHDEVLDLVHAERLVDVDALDDSSRPARQNEPHPRPDLLDRDVLLTDEVEASHFFGSGGGTWSLPVWFQP